MRITEIVPVTKAKYRVVTDEQLAFMLYKGELSRYRLKENGELPAETFQEIFKEILVKRAKLRAMHLLTRMDYTEAELEKKLMKGEYTPQAVKIAMDYVRSYHYLDDERYARQMIGRYKGTASRKMMMNKMKQKGLSDDVIREVMEASEWTDEMGITRELHRRFSSAEQIEEMADKERQKLIQSLMRKGYGYGDITHVMRYFEEIDQERV